VELFAANVAVELLLSLVLTRVTQPIVFSHKSLAARIACKSKNGRARQRQKERERERRKC
jgi:hypothetical protein